jgi:hypothetical protein
MKKVFAVEDSEEHVYNLQLAVWKCAVKQWRELPEEYDIDRYRFAESLCVIMVLMGTSMSQLLGQKTGQCSGDRVPGVACMLKKLEICGKLQSVLDEFNTTYEDLRHFGFPKHEPMRSLLEERLCASFEGWASAVQRLWIEVGQPEKDTINEWFSEDFRIEAE